MVEKENVWITIACVKHSFYVIVEFAKSLSISVLDCSISEKAQTLLFPDIATEAISHTTVLLF